MGKPQGGLEMDLCLPLGEREGPLQSPSEMAAHQHPPPPPPPAPSRKAWRDTKAAGYQPHCSQAKVHPRVLLSPARAPLITTGASAGLSRRSRDRSPRDARQEPSSSWPPGREPSAPSLTPSATSPLAARARMQLVSPAGQPLTASWSSKQAQTHAQPGVEMSWSTRQHPCPCCWQAVAPNHEWS